MRNSKWKRHNFLSISHLSYHLLSGIVLPGSATKQILQLWEIKKRYISCWELTPPSEVKHVEMNATVVKEINREGKHIKSAVIILLTTLDDDDTDSLNTYLNMKYLVVSSSYHTVTLKSAQARHLVWTVSRIKALLWRSPCRSYPVRGGRDSGSSYRGRGKTREQSSQLLSQVSKLAGGWGHKVSLGSLALVRAACFCALQ